MLWRESSSKGAQRVALWLRGGSAESATEGRESGVRVTPPLKPVNEAVIRWGVARRGINAKRRKIQMKKPFWVITLLFCACTLVTAPIRNKMQAPGTMTEAGTVEPCHDYRTDQQACGNAIWDAHALTQVQPGQTRDEVRAIMKRDPERREISGNGETWMYLTNYDNGQLTAVTFTDGKVTGMKQVAKSD
jgi:outer membrane protein assembly factor BamE (lipoprotein component of BamABCDE complex)